MLRKIIFQFILLTTLSISVFADFNPIDISFRSYMYGNNNAAADRVNKIIVQNDGKIILGGQFTKYHGQDRNNIVRINTDGTLDETFNIGTGADNNIYDMILLSNGQILVAGEFRNFNGRASNGIVRLNTNGSVDQTFISPTFTSGPNIKTISLLSNGKIMIGGTFIYTVNSANNWALARLNSNGAIDQTFLAKDNFLWVEKIATQSNDKVIVSGAITVNGVRHTIVRVNTDASNDNTFIGDTGNRFYQDVKIQSDGKIIISGNFITYKGVEVYGIARLLSNGNLDATFNSGGTGVKFRDQLIGIISNLTIQPDGKIIAAGNFGYYNNTNVGCIVRLNTNGTLDPTFRATRIEGLNSIQTTAVQTDQKILIGGGFTLYEQNTNTYFIARLLNCLAPDSPVNTSTKTTYCRDELGELSVTGSGTIKWYTSRTGTTAVHEGLVFDKPVNSFSYYVETSNSCAVNLKRTEIHITLNSKPITTASGASNVCEGSAVTLRGSSSITSVRATSFSWSDGVVNDVSFVPTETKTYTVTGTADNGCSSTANITVTVNPIPTITAAATTNSVCAGGSVTLTASGATSYTWSDGVTNGVSFVPNQTKTYTVTGTSNNCSNTATVNIEVKPVPNITASASNTSVCTGTAVTLTASGATSYTWTDDIENGISFIPIITKTYTVTGIANSCSNTANVTVEVKTIPNITASASENTVCQGTPVTLTANGAASYSWSNGRTNGVSFIPNTTRTYTVTGTTNGCINTANVTVEVKPLPDTDIVSNRSNIRSVQDNAIYQWINCTKDSIMIEEINQVFFTDDSSEYKVIITLDGCIDSSICVTRRLTTTGLGNTYEANLATIFPNPSNGIFTIEAAERGNYTIVNENGQIITSFTVKNKNDYTLQLENIDNGIYYLIGNQEENKQTKRQKIVIIK